MRAFDELNILPIDDFFDEMDLPDEEKEKRKKFSESMNETMLFIFALFAVMEEHGGVNKKFIISQLQERYSGIVSQFTALSGYIEDYIERFSKEIIDTTVKHKGEEYYLSRDRAMLISENEAQSIMGYRQLQEAKADGYTRKTWVTERDEKVRKSHREVDGATVDIGSYFEVDGILMLYPHDFNAPPEQTANCRCVAKYS